MEGLQDDSNCRIKRYFSILVQFWYSVNCPKVSVLTFVHFTVMGLSPSAVQTNLTRGSLMAALILWKDFYMKLTETHLSQIVSPESS